MDILSPITIGGLPLRNRVFFAPCTRCRADEQLAPHALNALYYRQRASMGLIITEATQINQEAQGYPRTPGVFTEAQVEGWKRVTDAVHEAGGAIYCQLWHVGRVSHMAYQPNGALPLCPSATPRKNDVLLPDWTKTPAPTPRAMTLDDIRRTIDDYGRAGRNALRAGFDGVELHGANGYLPDQFLRDGVNQRTDDYGGPIENRARFMLEAARALCNAVGPARLGIRLSPSGVFNDMADSNPKATYGYVATRLSAMNPAYLHITEAQESDAKHGRATIPGYEPIPASYFRPMVKCPLVTNGGFTLEKANHYLREGWADAIAFGVAAIANPDLVERFRTGAPLNTVDPSTFYGGGEKGYTDYPFLPVTR
jgi:N-ethylmaleimide reductase